MKLPLGITLTLLLILQTFQQVSADIPEEWKRENDSEEDNKQPQTSSQEITVQPIGGGVESLPANPNSSENEGQSYGSIFMEWSGGDKPDQNSTTLDVSVNKTEEADSEGPIATTPHPMIALNSSSEISDTSAESNETLTQDTATNTSTPEPELPHQSAPNVTYTSPEPETTMTESNADESGSGYLPSDDVPTNSTTTKSPPTTTEDVSIQNKTAVSPTEPPVYTTTTSVSPPAVPEDVTTPIPKSEDTGENLTGLFDIRENSGRGSSSDTLTDVTENKKGQSWAVVLVIGIIVGVIALGVFIFLNRRNRRDFSHRKLEEETSPDPVLRLDNNEPLDLRFEGFGYYNPGLQGDNIQMTNFPQGRSK